MVAVARVCSGVVALKVIVFYTVASTVVWVVVSALGAGIGWSLFLSLTVPPALLVAWALWRLV